MKQILLWATLLLVLVGVNLSIMKKEKTLAEGRTMLLELAPVDPRSLIQGDYMMLRYRIAQDVPKEQLRENGCIVVSLDSNNIAKFIKIHEDEKLQADEYLLFYRNRGGLRLGAESFLFQEGDVKLYSRAKYGELKTDESGASVLLGLRGGDFNPLGRKRK